MSVAYGLKDIQDMGEEHGRVNLSNICLTDDVVLKDSLLLDAEEKLVHKDRRSDHIEGYPSPQKLKSLYDSITSFAELRGDLFSLGFIALQLHDLNEDVSLLYINPNPVYRNYSIDLPRLAELIGRIQNNELRNAIEILTAMETKRRMEIYSLINNLKIDEKRLPMFCDFERRDEIVEKDSRAP